MIPSDRTEPRAYAPSHALVWMRRPVNALGHRLAAYTGAGLALIVLIVEQFL